MNIKIEYPTQMIDVYSLGRKVKFRPFLVREEKILMIAKESKDPEEIRNSILQIIQNCVCEEIDIGTLPLFDIEMIFLKLRAMSVGESIKLVFNCQNVISVSENDEETICNANTDYTLNLNKVVFEVPEGHTSKVMINDKIGVKLKYPTLHNNVKSIEGEDPYLTLLRMIIENVEYIFTSESVVKPTDMQPNELVDFMDGLRIEDMERIKYFFVTSPKVVLMDEVTCNTCGTKHQIHTENLLSFFI